MFINPNENPTMRYLSLNYRPSYNDEHATSGRFFDSLCSYIERTPPPLPNLRVLEITLVDRDGTMVSIEGALVTRLRNAILDRGRRRYPHFHTLMINVKMETWVSAWGMWMSRPGTHKGRKEQTKGRWRSAFSAFSNCEDVSLVVNVADGLQPPFYVRMDKMFNV